MKCSQCQHDNPDGARFCSNCGSALTLFCENCGAILPADARFCNQCGQPVSGAKTRLTPPSAEQADVPEAAFTARDRLQRYIPKELLTRLDSARRSRLMEGERRVVTILFCDVRGSTLAASRLDPEEWAEIMNGAFEHMIAPVYRYEGTVARLQGDGLLAFFGAPIAHEDDPQRAVLAGLEIVESFRTYGAQVQDRWGIDFAVRVGINTGLVVVGEVGSDLRVEYTALGDAINLAARMEQHAPAGSVLAAEPTYRLVAPLFDFVRIEGLELKGYPAPVVAYHILSQKAQPGSLRGLPGLHAPLIGRQEQMETLWSAAAAVKQHHGQIVSVIGEAGLGKSRLITEFRRDIQLDTALPHQWLEGRSLSYETTVPFAPFIPLFRNFFELRADSEAGDPFSRLLDRLGAYYPERAGDVAPFFASLLDIPLQGEAADRVRYLPPPQLRGLLFTWITDFLKRMLQDKPVILYLDDLHWSDRTSIEMLQALLPLTDQAPLMVITAFRPRRQELSWDYHEHVQREYNHRYRVVSLEPLDAANARELVANLLEIDDLPENVRLKILEKSEGNPFFVEEIIRSLIDHKLVERMDGHWHANQEIKQIDIPDTLAGVITARLDRLDENTKHILQTAAVIGREFAADLLEKIVEVPDQVGRSLLELQRRELVREKNFNEHPTYIFKHVLTQEAAYNSILLGNRRVLHRLAAEALIDSSSESAPEIARHLLEAQLFVQAVPYLVQAGDRAARAYATAEATEYYRQALAQKAAITDLNLLRRAYEGLGGVLTFANRIDEAQSVYQEMQATGEAAANIPMQISSVNKLAGVMALHKGDFQEADLLLNRAEHLTHQYNEKSGIAETNLLRCQMCTAQADFENVVKYMGEVVQTGQELGNHELIALGLEHISTSQLYMLEFDESWRNAKEALEMARVDGDRALEAKLLSLPIPLIHLHAGHPDAAVEALIQGLDIATMIGDLFSQAAAAYFLAEIARGRGEYERALHYGQLALTASLPLEQYAPFMLVLALSVMGMIYQEFGPALKDKIAEFHLHAQRLLESPLAATTGAVAWADLGLCALALGDLEIAEHAINRDLNTPGIFSQLERPRHLAGAALLAMARGDLVKARRMADEAQSYVSEHKLGYHAPLTYLVRGKVYIASGELEASLDALEQARKAAGVFGMLPVVMQAHIAAAKGLSAAGRLESAEGERAAAEGIAIEIANQITDLELRNTYLRHTLSMIH